MERVLRWAPSRGLVLSVILVINRGLEMGWFELFWSSLQFPYKVNFFYPIQCNINSEEEDGANDGQSRSAFVLRTRIYKGRY
jgi:hypothetical protein